MNYENLVRDFAKRTRANLVTLRSLPSVNPDLKVYEVTQLINSMLGLLVFPEQRYFNHIPKTSPEDLIHQGWPIPEVEGDYPQVNDLQELVRYLRNGITHCNVEFLADSREQIDGLRVWNTNPRTGKTTWKARLTLEDMEKITDKFIQLLLEE
jgi:hypothetical protein